MRLFFPILIVSLLMISCNARLNVKEADALVKVGNKILYKNTVDENIPTGLSSEDSIIAAEHFIHAWISEVLLYDIALKNSNDKENIDRLVENYRKSLLIYQYEEQLINEKLVKGMTEKSLFDYYNQNKEKFKLEYPLIKGIFLKVPNNISQLDEIRTWYKSITSTSSQQNFGKYINNVVLVNYFVDKWLNFDELMDGNWPVQYHTKEDLTVSKKTIERQDSTYCYFLNISDFLLPGENTPFEYAKSTIQDILINQQKIEFLKKIEDELYQRALNKGDIKFYNK